jgi:hypothetical protein
MFWAWQLFIFSVSVLGDEGHHHAPCHVPLDMTMQKPHACKIHPTTFKMSIKLVIHYFSPNSGLAAHHALPNEHENRCALQG